MPVASTTADTATFVVRAFSSRSMASVGQASAHLPAALAPGALLDRVRVGHAPVRGPVGGPAPREAGFERIVHLVGAGLRAEVAGDAARRIDVPRLAPDDGPQRSRLALHRDEPAAGPDVEAVGPAPVEQVRGDDGPGAARARAAPRRGRAGSCAAGTSSRAAPSCPPRESPRFDEEHGEARVREVQRGPLAGGPAARDEDRLGAFTAGLPAVVAASTSCTRSITRMRSCRAFTAFASVRTHWGQADTRWSAPAAAAWSTRRADTAATSAGSKVSRSPPPPQHRACSRLFSISTSRKPGSAREHLARLVVVPALAAEVAGVVERDHARTLRLRRRRGARRRRGRASSRRTVTTSKPSVRAERLPGRRASTCSGRRGRS